MAIGLHGVVEWAHRRSDAARQASSTTHDPQQRAAVKGMSQRCRRVPFHGATHFAEALQSILLIHLALSLEGQGTSLSLGCLDRTLAPFAQEVEQDFETSVELIAHFLLLIAANGVQGRSSKTQCITLGGILDDGSDACNAVTLAFLEAFHRTPVSDPHLFFRWHPSIDTITWDRALKMISSSRSMPMLVNDDAVIRDLKDLGLDPNHVTGYSIVGCNEIGIPGRHHSLALSPGLQMNDLAPLTEALEASPLNPSQALDAWQKGFEERLEEGTKQWESYRIQRSEHRPMPFTTALFRQGPREARNYLLLEGNDLPCLYTRGFSNLVNSIKNLEPSPTSLPWGNDDDACDALALEVERVTKPSSMPGPSAMEIALSPCVMWFAPFTISTELASPRVPMAERPVPP